MGAKGSSKKVENKEPTVEEYGPFYAWCEPLKIVHITLKYTNKDAGAKLSITVKPKDKTYGEALTIDTSKSLLTQGGIVVDKANGTVRFAPRSKLHEPEVMTFSNFTNAEKIFQQLLNLGEKVKDEIEIVEQKSLPKYSRMIDIEFEEQPNNEGPTNKSVSNEAEEQKQNEAPSGSLESYEDSISETVQAPDDDFMITETTTNRPTKWTPCLKPYDKSAPLIKKVHVAPRGPPQLMRMKAVFEADAPKTQCLAEHSETPSTVLEEVSKSQSRRLASTSNTMDDAFSLMMMLPFILLLVLLFKRITESYSKKDDVVADNEGVNHEDALHNIL